MPARWPSSPKGHAGEHRNTVWRASAGVKSSGEEWFPMHWQCRSGRFGQGCHEVRLQLAGVCLSFMLAVSGLNAEPSAQLTIKSGESLGIRGRRCAPPTSRLGLPSASRGASRAKRKPRHREVEGRGSLQASSELALPMVQSAAVSAAVATDQPQAAASS